MAAATPAHGLLATISAAFLRDLRIQERQMAELEALSVQELERAMESEELQQGLQEGSPADQIGLQPFNEIETAVPGRMTREELLRVLSGGTRRSWGPAKRLAKQVVARRDRKTWTL